MSIAAATFTTELDMGDGEDGAGPAITRRLRDGPLALDKVPAALVD